MKKITLLFAALFTALISVAQTNTGGTGMPNQNQRVRLGLSFSPVLSWFATSGDAGLVEPDGVRFNIAFGLNTDFRIGPNGNYYFSTGLFLLNTGGTIKHEFYTQNENGDFFLTDRTADFRINYVNVPFTVLLRTNEIGYMRYFGRVGFDVGFNTKSTYDYEDLREGISETITLEDESASSITGLIRTGLHIEAGFEYNVGGSTNLYFSATYNGGLNNVFNEDYELPTGQTIDDSNRLAVDPDSGLPFTEREVKAQTNMVLLTVGAYF